MKIEYILQAHKECCPYWVANMGTSDKLTGWTIKCGANQTKCNSKCHYMTTFKRKLKQKLSQR